MWILSVVVLLLCGFIAAAPLVIAKRPDAQQVLDKIAPYQGYLGVVALVWGLWSAISFILNINVMFHYFFLGLMTAVAIAVEICLGFLLSFPLLQLWLFSKNEQASAKAAVVRAKLMPFQVALGVAAVVIVLVFVMANMMARSAAPPVIVINAPR